MLKHLALATCLLCLPVRAAELSGAMDNDTVLTVSGSPYHVVADVTLAPLTVLTIEPGVVLEFDAGVSLRIKGELQARGAAESPIVFTGSAEAGEPARWGSIVFDNSSDDASFSFLDDYQAGSIMEHCVIEGATRGVVLEWASPYLFRSTFRQNRTPFSVDIEGGAALTMKPGSAPRVRECTFEDNVADGFNYGGALYIDDAQPILQDNTFVNNTSVYGGAVCTTLMASPIVGNVFDDNHATGTEYSKGGGLSMVSSVSAVLNNTFTNNSSVLDGGGIHVCIDCFPHATPFFMDNTITGNAAETDDPAKGAGGLGAGFVRVVTDNNIHGNTRHDEPSDFGWFHPLEEGLPDWIAHRSVAGNWWGTDDASAVADAVVDGTDVEGVGTVTVEPIRVAPVAGAQPRVTLTTRRLQFDEIGEQMPLYLTVYNPGPEALFELRLMLVYDGGRSVPYPHPLGLPNEVVRAATHQFRMPENGVFFATIATSTYDGPHGLGPGRWLAALYAADGALLGEMSAIRFDLLEEVAL